MDTIELLVEVDKIEILKNFFKKYINNEDSMHDSISFKASFEDKFLTTVYKNGLVIISGKDKEKIYSRLAKYKLNEFEQISTSSFGHENYFGPIVASSVYINQNDIEYINNLNLSSCDFSLKELLTLGKELVSKLKYEIMIFKEEDINKRVEKNWSKNRILSILYNSLNVKIGSYFKNKNLIMVDEICSGPQYFSYIKKESFNYKSIIFINNSINKIKLSKISNIIAKYYYILIMKKQSKELGINIPINNNNLEYNLNIIHDKLKDKLYTLQNLTKTYFKEVNNFLDKFKIK